MPIKKINVTFELDMNTFVQMIALGNSGMRFDVYGDTPKVKKEQKLLEGPPRIGAKNILLACLSKNKDKSVSAKELSQACMEGGYAKNSASPQLHVLMKNGKVKKTKDGYQITAKGLNNGKE
jgi:hypothetical protein